MARLQQRLERGEVKLDDDETTGYLTAVLKELQIPVSSQGVVFSKTSLQLHRIDPHHPRAIFLMTTPMLAGFVVAKRSSWPGFTPCGEESSTFSTRPAPLVQSSSAAMNGCSVMRPKTPVTCPVSWCARSTPIIVGTPICSLCSRVTTHTSPLCERWGGGYVTGAHGTTRHAGNLLFEETSRPDNPESLTGGNLTSLVSKFSLREYLSPHSEIVALLVLEHQIHTQPGDKAQLWDPPRPSSPAMRCRER